MSITTDLSKFGFRELKMAGELLTAYGNGDQPDDFDGDEVTVMMNTNSGSVFLTNSECRVAMMNGDRLESWYNCPECGHEGFKEDMAHGEDDPACQRFLIETGLIDGSECPDCGETKVVPSDKACYDWRCEACGEEGWNDTAGKPASNSDDTEDESDGDGGTYTVCEQ